MSGRALDVAGIADQNLRASYEECRRLLARHDRAFYLAGQLLPLWKRPYVHALYGFARQVDQMVDRVDLPPDQKARRFDAWTERFRLDLHAGHSHDPIVRALLHTMATWKIAPDLVADFVAAMRTDLTVTSFPTYADLESYMYGAASTLALQILPILQPSGDGVSGHVRSFGLALQLTNIVRDVGEDLERGRVYLPVEDLSRFNVTLDDLYGRRPTEKFRSLVAFEIERARALYAHARVGLTLLPPSSRNCLDAGMTLYGDTLNTIESNGYDVLTSSARASRVRRLRIAFPAYLRAMGMRRREHLSPVTPAPPVP